MHDIEMFSPATYQFIIFMEAIIIGFILGFLLDFYRSLRNTISLSHNITILTDFIFWIVATVSSLVLLVLILWGEVHLYTYFGLVGGFFIYYFLLSRYILFLWNKVFGIVMIIIRFLLKCIRSLLVICMFVKFPFFNRKLKR